MIPEERLEITYFEFGPGSSNTGIPHRVDRPAKFLNEPTGQLLPIRRISCSNPHCNMNCANSRDYYSRGYSIESLIHKVSETEKPIHGERVYCEGSEKGRHGPHCENFIEVTITVKDVS